MLMHMSRAALWRWSYYYYARADSRAISQAGLTKNSRKWRLNDPPNDHVPESTESTRLPRCPLEC